MEHHKFYKSAGFVMTKEDLERAKKLEDTPVSPDNSNQETQNDEEERNGRGRS